MLLANAVYFKADWKLKFDPLSTHKRKFKNFHGEKFQVDFMTQENMIRY
jgi:serine protease inhibitor